MENAAATSEKARTAVFYDGSCPLCSAEVRYYRARDDADILEFVDVSTADANLPDGMSQTEAMSRFHARRPDGKVVSGAAAFTEVWSHTRGWRWLAKLANVPGALILMEGFYRVFLFARPLIVRVFSVLTGSKPN